MTDTIRAAICTRVSTEEQAQVAGCSIAALRRNAFLCRHKDRPRQAARPHSCQAGRL